MREETRNRILESMRALNYQPNTLARGLRSRRTNTVAFLTIDPAPRFLADPFHVTILSGMADALRTQDYCLFVQGLAPDRAGETFQRLVRQRRFDGAVVHLSGARRQREQHVQCLQAGGCPFVLIEERTASPAAACVLADNRGGSAQAVEFLQAGGHTRIGFLTTDRPWPAVEARVAGYEEAVRKTGCRWSKVWKVGRECTESAREAMERVLRREPALTAVLCATDVLALGALQAAGRLGRGVPAELAVVGFDDFEFARYVDPPLTTVALPGYDMGRRAAELLLGYFKEGRFAAPEVVFPVTLVRRGSA
jgi:DNA-binding LacI/PurR family transcriptional regulator